MSILSRIISRIWNEVYGAPVSEEQILDEQAETSKTDGGADLTGWRTSITDFCKLIGIDSSLENRSKLARELGMDAYSGTGSENVELSKRLLAALRGD